MMLRLVLLLLAFATPLRADSEQVVTDVVSTLTSALSENNSELFLKTLDHKMPGYGQIEQNVIALMAQTLISCSVEVISTGGTEAAPTADLDWYMSLKSQQDYNVIERRRTKVTIALEKRGKKWVVTSFSPLSLFAPMQAK
jgi:hypothetical protein